MVSIFKYPQQTSTNKNNVKDLLIEQNVISSNIIEDFPYDYDIEEMLKFEIKPLTQEMETLKCRYLTIQNELKIIFPQAYEEQFSNQYHQTLLAFKKFEERLASRLVVLGKKEQQQQERAELLMRFRRKRDLTESTDNFQTSTDNFQTSTDNFQTSTDNFQT
uniref:Uncharacterized protein n=1 Tax=Clytia hemisphaerica TaxID=252671 RepID=A0A7M5XK27_9CNID